MEIPSIRKIEIGCLFTPDTEKEFIQQINNRTFTRFKGQALQFWELHFIIEKNILFQHSAVKRIFVLNWKIYKDVFRLSNGCLT